MREREFIGGVLAEAGSMARGRYLDRSGLVVSSKLHAVDVLTDADEALQRFIEGRIGEAFPDDVIVGEELGSSVFSDEIRGRRAWVIDPIDGTQNFVRGLFPVYGVSVAFVDKGVIMAGGIALPHLAPLQSKGDPLQGDDGHGTIFLASKGEGATRDGVAIAVSEVDAVSHARVEVDFGNPLNRAGVVDAFTGVIRGCGEPRCHCATVVTLCSVACGEMDVYCHIDVKPWDYAAGVLIVAEAGGRVSQANGDAVDIWGQNLGLVATNGRLHDEVLHMTVLPE